MTEQAAEFTFGSWTAPQVPLTIEYPLEVMDEIRAAVSDGLQQLAHGGLEIGGVLFGARRESSIRILTWRPISCEHAHGPTLRLSPRDRIALARVLEVAKSDPDLKGLQPVGWFLSHARSDIFLTASDLEIYNGYFPEPWQVALVLRPTRSGPARAGFFAREADGTLRSDSSYQDFTIEPLQRALPAKEAPPPHADARAAPRLEPLREPASEPAVEPPRFLSARPAGSRQRWLWAIPACLALLIAGLLVKEKFLRPQAPMFSFRAYDTGETVQLEWDQNSPVIRESRRAVLDIKEAGQTKHYSLTSDHLQAGRMTYVRRGGDLEMRMTVYPSGGAPVQEFTRLLGPATAGPPSTAAAEEQSTVTAERDQLREQVRQLEEELRKERARADRMQETVRILQNRLDVDAARGQGPGARK